MTDYNPAAFSDTLDPWAWQPNAFHMSPFSDDHDDDDHYADGAAAVDTEPEEEPFYDLGYDQLEVVG